MCGIAGSYRLAVDVEAGLASIGHRGPDGWGVKSNGEAEHGHVRLALLDLSDASAQPFEYGSTTLSFVGEIWNYRKVRLELQKLGFEFSTTGDTEVLAVALDHWGLKALKRLDGMFSFAWSKRDVGHFLVTDRYGKIPLYVRREGDGYCWSSEKKGILAQSVAVPPASILDMNRGTVRKWYTVPQSSFPSKNLRSTVLRRLRAGVRARMHADAKVCCLISGGLDSSLILALAAEIGQPIAYTAFFDTDSPDLIAAREICEELEVELREVEIPAPGPEDATEAVRVIETSMKAQVEIAALCIPLAKRISADGFKACLSGEAADELFGGYGNMCIASSKRDWREIRLEQLSKMARGNFVRCNKAFMAAGVECRLPFMHRPLVEAVLSMTKAQCPPGKKLLMHVGEKLLPESIAKRKKETFQGASGISRVFAEQIHSPTRFYNAEYRRMYG